MPQTDSELKGGHPPAVKAGGMRICQNKPEKEAQPVPVSQGDTEEQEISSSPPKAVKQVINGVLAKGDADFPSEAVKAFHDNKPQPTHEYRSNNNNTAKQHIHQPKK